MADVVSAATHAGGLGTRPARLVFMLVWLCGVWLGVVDGYFTPLDPLNASAYGAGLLGGLLLTTPGSHRLPPGQVFLLPAIAVYITALSLYRAPAVMDVWALDFAAYLVAFLIARGNPVAGGVGSALIVGYALVWGLNQDPSGANLAFLIGIPIGCTVAGIVWRQVLKWIVLRERQHRSAAARAIERAKVSDEAIVLSRQERAGIRMAVEPLLLRIVAGDPIDEAMRTRLKLAEAAIRDRIRAPHLQHPLLMDEFSRLRERGVVVVALGEPAHDGEVIDTRLAEGVVKLMADVDVARVTIRTLPEGRAASVSVVLQAAKESEQILLAADGRVLSRT
jgi:hypothetical protein